MSECPSSSPMRYFSGMGISSLTGPRVGNGLTGEGFEVVSSPGRGVAVFWFVADFLGWDFVPGFGVGLGVLVVAAAVGVLCTEEGLACAVDRLATSSSSSSFYPIVSFIHVYSYLDSPKPYRRPGTDRITGHF